MIHEAAMQARTPLLSDDDREILRSVILRTAHLSGQEERNASPPPKPGMHQTSWFRLERYWPAWHWLERLSSPQCRPGLAPRPRNLRATGSRQLHGRQPTPQYCRWIKPSLSPILLENCGPYFYNNQTIPAFNHEPYGQFRQMAVMDLDLMDAYSGAAYFLPSSFLDYTATQRWLWTSFADSPDLCGVLAQTQDSYSDSFVNRAA
jgi:hypothetical protein